ncbi:MAG: UDP-glucose 4-epimerase [Thermoprotei archaeon]|nr:MAG: UDP-glucose 4-epimerase [Thermoprotei archaeon]
MKILVTGGAGFMGSHLVSRLVEKGYEVICLDNFSSGRLGNIKKYLVLPNFKLVRGDLREYKDITTAIRGCSTVFHLAANPEVRIGDPREHFENNLLASFNLLEAMRKYDVDTIVFASSSTVYGDARVLPTPEDYAPLKPISTYGASKLGVEALISAYSHTYGIKGIVLRYANVVGPGVSRGVVYDFVQKLRRNPRVLEVLGDGLQKKSYIWIDDAIDATIVAWSNSKESYIVYNVGSEDAIEVRRIAEIVVEEMGLKDVRIYYTGGVDGGRGWKGDVKFMHLDISRLKALGWKPKYRSEDAIRMTVRRLIHS